MTKLNAPASGHREHFDKIASDYSKASDTWAGVYTRIGELLSPLTAGCDVLDIGNGGFFPYDTTKARSVTVLDISPAMLDRIHAPNIRKVVGDARDLKSILDQSQDLVIYLLCLHHICGINRSETLEYLDDVLTSAARVLRPGGSIIIAEPVTGGWVHALQRASFGLVNWVLSLKGVPMIFFHHPQELKLRLAHALQTTEASVEATDIPVTGWVDPMGGSFPGLVKIPAWSCPTRYLFLRAQKPL